MNVPSPPLSRDQLDAWHRDGYLHLPGFLANQPLADVVAAIDDIGRRPDGDRQLLQHYELVGDEAQICRSEHLLEGYPLLRRVLSEGWMPTLAAALFDEPALLYKEKVNYKLAGGAGFSPHQDAPAYPFVDTHVTCMLAIDDATLQNGCLEVVAARHGALLPMDGRSCIHPDVVAQLDWQPVPVRAGDLLWFHSRTPHRSGRNPTDRSRRALFCTYAAARHGDLREAYYAEKMARFASASTDVERGTTRVSLIDDFEGAAPRPDHIRRLEFGRAQEALDR